METNLPDDVKQQQQKQQPSQNKKFSDHAYSITPSSPQSDSGISSGPYSPSNSSNSIEDLSFDIERDLFGPLDLKTYEDVDNSFMTSVDPAFLDSVSECSTSPSRIGNESPMSFGKFYESRNLFHLQLHFFYLSASALYAQRM